jgi:uncharacterized membrane protein YbhN (UPF0104 family)
LPSASTQAPAPPAARRTRRGWALARTVGGVCILAVLVWRVGTGPFLDGVRAAGGPALAVALGIGVLTTICGAWRWRMVAAGLGVRLPLRDAVAACYRSQFLNTTLPGGVLGDVHRAVRHGRDIGDVRLGVHAVVLERVAGQSVQIAIAVIVLCLFPSPVRAHMPATVAALLAAGLVALLVAVAVSRGGSRRWTRALRAAGAGVHKGLFARGAWLGVLATSAVAVAGHLATFVLAARTAGSTAPLALLVPLTLLALLAMAVPVNLAGWGPREGVAAWAFAAAGLTAAQGIATAVTYGVLVFAASLPGAAVLPLPLRGGGHG